MNPRILQKAEQAAEDVIWLRREIAALATDLVVAERHYQEMAGLLWLPDVPKVSVNEVN